RSGLVPLLPAPAPATRGDLDGLVLVRDSHDVEALLTALAAARANGVSVVPAATLAGIGPAPLPIPARLAGAAAFAGFDLWRALADVVVALAGLATLLMLVRLVVVAILATVQARRRVTSAGTVPTVAVLVAAYNEEVGIGSCVRSILTSDLPALQVVVVDDGSTDGTATAAAQAGADDPRFFDLVNAVSVVPGALGAFRRDLVVRVGGFPRDTLAEDADLTVSIGKLGYRVRTVADARAWTEVPATWRALWKQRYRWSYGTL